VARPASNLRLFVAAYPELDVARQWLERLAGPDLPPSRLTPLHQVHLTLLFIGDTPVRQMDAAIESVERACSGIRAFELTPQRLIALPDEKPGQPARLIAVESDAPASLLELQRRLALRLAGKPRKKPGRPFRPHFTLCRFATPAVLDHALPDAPPQAIPVSTIHLMRSTLTPEGAQHHQVRAFELER
jgi:RNA 2',3'-cyclic 3'-phosphodiesterase